HLATAEAIATPGTCGTGRHEAKLVGNTWLFDRRRHDHRAVDDGREELLLLPGAAAHQHCERCDQIGEERTVECSAANLLEQHTQLEIAEARAAIALGNDDAGPALLDHPLPELLRE